MDLNQNLSDFFADNNKGSGGSPGTQPAPAASNDLSGFLDAPKPQRQPITGDAVRSIAAQEGAEALLPVINAIYGQESGSGANARASIDGAQGGMQIMPATFRAYARAGERIDNPDDNMRVGVRIIKDLASKFGNDPAKIATGYFSGEGNVNAGQGNAWKNDAADGNGKRVSGYVADVLKRVGVAPAQQSGAPDLAKAPKWTDIEAKPEFKNLTPEKQAEARAAYFDHFIAPHAGQQAQALRDEFLAAGKKAEPGFLDKAAGVVKDIGGAVVDALSPAKSVLETQGMQPPADLPTTSRVPVRPEVRAAFNAAWDAATPDQRQAMQAQEGWTGMLARERAGVFERADKNRDGMSPGNALEAIDPRAEYRRARLVAAGENPEFAERAAREGAAKGAMPGAEIQALGGTIKASDFDFDTKALFDSKGGSNGLNNPLVRGISKGVLGVGKAGAGYMEFLADVTGMDASAKTMKNAGDFLRGKEEAIGEQGDYLSRNLEGAISSISQQLPLMIAGVKAGSQAIPLAGMAMQSFGQEYSDGKARGQSTAQAATRASIFAAFEVIGEKFGLGQQMEALRAAAKGMPSDQIIDLLWSALKKEVPGEILTTTGQFATDKFAPMGVGLNPNATFNDYVKQVADTIGQTVMQSGLMGAGTTGVSKGVRFLREAGKSTTETDAEYARQQALNKWAQFSQAGRTEPTVGQVPAVSEVTPDGRIEPTLEGVDAGSLTTQPQQPAPAEPTASPIVDTAEQIVRELAEQAGVPLETVLPTPQDRAPAPQPEPAPEPLPEAAGDQQFGDQDVQDFAAGRYQQLRSKRDGEIQTVASETGMVDQNVPGDGLSPAEAQELQALETAAGDVNALRALYGFDQAAGQTAPFAEQIAPQAEQQPPIAQQQPVESEADREARLEREAIQSPEPVVQQADDSDIPFDAPAATQPAPVPAKPRTEKEANQAKDYTGKWFGSAAKAQQFIADKNIGATHEVVVNGTKFEIKRKDAANGTQAPQAQQAKAQGQEAPAAAAPVTEAASEKTGRVKKSYEVFDEDGNRFTINIVRDTDGKLFRIFNETTNEEGKTQRAELSPGYGDGISDDYIVKAIAEPMDWSLTKPEPKPKTEKEARARRENVSQKPAENDTSTARVDAGDTQSVAPKQQGDAMTMGVQAAKDGKPRTPPAGMTDKAAFEWMQGYDGQAGTTPAADQPKTDTSKFAGNTLFTADRVEAARARMRSKLGNMNSGIDPELLVDGMTIAGAYVESGVRKYADYTKAMVEDFGDKIRPYLRSFYEAVRNYPGLDTAGMSTPAEIDLMEKQGTAEHVKPAPGTEAAVGQKVEAPKRRTERKTPGAVTLRNDYGVPHIDGYDNKGEGPSGPTKTQFLNDTKKYLTDVAAALQARGFTPPANRQGKPVKAVSVNESGVATSGDVSLTLFNQDMQRGIYITIGGTSLRGVVPTTASGVSVMMRVTKAGDPYGGDQNRWMPVSLTSAELADLAVQEVEKVATRSAQSSVAKPAKQAQNVIEETQDANPVQAQPVPEAGAGKTQQDDAAGNRDRQPVGTGLAADGQGVDRGGRVSASAQDAGATGARSPERAGQQPSGETRDRAGDGAQPEPAVTKPADDFVIDAEDIGKGGLAKKYRDNVAAITILKTLESEGRVATPDERKQLAKYVGWGAMKGPFDPDNKQWSKQHAELKELLTDAEFRAARKSTLDAHYTSPVAVGAMYEALTRLGFSGGRVLEPSVGVGNFFGLMPAAMRNASQLHGVELDSLTSRMVAALYPKAKIAKATGFENFQIPAQYFDVVIGNPPFGSQPLVDAERSAYSGFSIHNYFLAKGIDKLRPGGVMVVVVSHNFLDAQDGRARKWIGERAQLIGGVRLPNTAFKENAGTEVVTDILIFQKNDNDAVQVDNAAPWQNIVDQVNTNPKTGETVTHKVNQFFTVNPQFVLGTPSAGGSMYSANEYTVEASGDIKAQLADWVKSLPDGVYDNIDRKADSAVVDMAIPDGIKVGSFYVDANGKVMQRGEDVLGNKTANEWTPPNEKAVARIKGMIALRESLRKQMRLERTLDASESDIEANRAEMNKLYDDFLSKHGHLNNQTNRRIFLDDTEAQLLQALEFDYDKGISKAVAEKEGIEQREPSAVKADIFKRRVAFPPQDFLTVSTAKDALLASLNYRGKVDMPYMAEVYGKDADAIIKELGDVVYDDPQAGTVTADEYLSGDVKTKLVEAKAAAQGDAKYKRNVEALEKVIPKDKKPSEISVSIGAAFVPAEIYQQFVKHISGSDSVATYVKATGQWLIDFKAGSDPALNTGKFGTSELSAQELFNLSMLGRGAVVKKTFRNPDGTTTTVLMEKETEAAREKQNAIKAEWQSWLWGDAARADMIAALYNEKMNRIVERQYDGSHMTFPGMNPAISLLAHQKNGVWRGLQSYQVLYDHVVGAGKTFEMATLAMEMRRLGISRKPLFVVPNHLTLQWRSEFTRLYPGSNILAATPEDFSKENRERLFSKIITGDWDAVVVGHSSLKKIGLPAETEQAVLQEQIDEIAQAIEDMKRGRGDRNIIRDMEGIRSRLEAKMKDKLTAIGKRSKVVTFDELGIDAMFIDEMHEFKNLAYNSTMDRNPGMGNPAGSAKAFDLFVKTRWLFDTFGAKTPYITATGTPVSNSLVEMYNMQRYMQYPTLKAQGLHVFDAWAKQFGSVENVYEVAPSGAGYRQSTRFAKFTNLPGLMGLYNSFADTITLDDLKAQEESQGKKFPVPKLVTGRPVMVVAKRSPAVAALMGVPKAEMTEAGGVKFLADLDAQIQITQDDKSGKFSLKVGDDFMGQYDTEQDARLKLVERAVTPKVTVDPQSILGRFANLRQLTKESKGKINALSLTGEANKAGLDYRLVNPGAADFAGSKINMAVDNMLKVYRQWDADKGTQLVFCDLSIPLSARASYSSKARRLYVRDDAGAVEMKRGTMHTLEGHENLPYFIVQRGDKDLKRFDVYDAASGRLMGKDYRSKPDAVADTNEKLTREGTRQSWIDKRERAGEIEQSEIDEYNNDNDVEINDMSMFFTREDIAGMSGSANFSVYDDIKAKLIAKGVPEREIAFIHDYSTPTAKDKLFKAVNTGEVRFLLGSTPKMGAGTNVQKRLVGLHHIDAPWRPSDLEQREGRIIRRGNELYARDPEGFEVFVARYATEQTYDTRRWQILEHKARGIEQLRNFDGSINEIDDIEGEAANSADMKAAASGDPMILEETKLRNDVRRLEQLQAGHADEVLALNRKARAAQEYADKDGPAFLERVQSLIAVVNKNPVDKDGFAAVTVDGKTFGEKEAAQAAIAKAVSVVRSSMAENVTIQYRGLEFTVEQGRAGWIHAYSPTGEIGNWGPSDPFSSSGFVQRLSNFVGRVPAFVDDTKARIEKSAKDADALREQAKQPFAQAKELESTREEYKKVQRALLAKGPTVPENQKAAVAKGIADQRAKLDALGYGEALREFFQGQSDETATGPRLMDIKRSPSVAFAGVPEQVRVNARQKLEKLDTRLEAGKITEAEFRLGVQEVIAKMGEQRQEREYRRMVNGRRRGADWIVAQMRRGVADGTVEREAADFAQWLLEQNPNVADGLGISVVSEGERGQAAEYMPLPRIMKLIAGRQNTGSAVHEILHHSERMMPVEVQDGVLKEWQRAWDAAYKAGDAATKELLRDMLKASTTGDRKASDRVADAFGSGKLTYDKHYQLYSPSEYWAVNATRILSDRYAAKGSWVKRAVQWFKEFVERIKGVFGMRSDAPIIKALRDVMQGEGRFQSPEMLVERVANGDIAPSLSDITRRIQNNLVQFFGNRDDKSLKTFGAYDKTLSTQYNKALKDKHYGKVFAYVNAMQNEVSLTSIRPAELAPGILPRVDDVKSAARQLVKGKKADKNLEQAAEAIFAGTLNVPNNVMAGKVWTTDELRQRGLNDTGIALYRQGRAAIDASLDELAAAEAYAMAQGLVPKAMRRTVIDNPGSAETLIAGEIKKQVKMLDAAIRAAKKMDNAQQEAELRAARDGYVRTLRNVEKIFVTAKNLKAAGYAPLMRFGKFTVTVQVIDPMTGNVARDADGEALTEFYGQYETEGEAKLVESQMRERYADQPDMRVRAGTKSQTGYELYAGISPETLALFAEAVGADQAMRKHIELAMSERSALKRRLDRKGTTGYSQDLPRVLSNFITSNGRFAAQRYYLRDLNNAIKYIPKEKGDVMDEALRLKKFITENVNDPGAAVSSVMFAWFLGGSVASAVVNLTQPVLMTAPYLSQFGAATATKALMGALPYAMGRKEISDTGLRDAIKRASQEGIVDAQEIFHLYSVGAQGVASGLVNSLSKLPAVGDKIKAGSEDARARINAFLTLWGSMFALAEGFNRKLTFLAAWEVAKANNEKNPYAFAVRAVNETQGIYNKANRPNWAQNSVGRTVLTFKQFSLMYIELLSRMWKRGGPEGKRAAVVMLAVLMLAAGEEGLPFAQDVDDLIDTIGQLMGFDTNMRRNKRRLAHELLGKSMGDLFLYGVSSQLPLDFAGRLGLGNLVPGTSMLKPSTETGRSREVADVFGPVAGMATQIVDAYDAATDGNTGKAVQNLAPKAIKDLMAASEMASKGYATDVKGRKVVDVTLADAVVKGTGFNPTVVATETRKTMPVQQDIALQKRTESSIVDQWARGVADKDDALVAKAKERMTDWNRDNPDTPVAIRATQIRDRVRQMKMDKDARLLKQAPREMRGRVAPGLDAVD